MSVETLQTLSLSFLIAAGLLFLAAVALFFIFNIPKLISEITGIAERKGIAAIQERSEHGGTGNIKDTSGHLASSGQLPSENNSNMPSSGTKKLVTTKLTPSQDTTVLNTTLSEGIVKQHSNPVLPVLYPDTVFTIIEEFSFTSSAEIIE